MISFINFCKHLYLVFIVQEQVPISHNVIEDQEAVVIDPIINNIALDGLSRGTFERYRTSIYIWL